jgi:SPOR domain
MMRITLLLITSLFAHILFGQDSIVVKKDPRLDILSAKQAQINKRTSLVTSSGMIKGFRLQVVSTTNRDVALRSKADLLSRYPEHKAYLLFQSPYFKVRFGNFLKREDAEKMRKVLNKHYPQGVFVVEDGIEYTLKDDEEL